MKKILITGGNGFIGSHLYEQLKAFDYEIKILTRNENESLNHTICLDLSEDRWSLNPCDNIDTIFHLAGKAHALSEIAQDDEEYKRVNTEGTRKLLEAAQKAGVKRFIYFSSVKAVGDELGCQGELNTKPADSPYGMSKWEAEQLVLKGGYVPHPVVIRPSMVYGNSDKGNLPRMIHAIEKGFFPPLPDVNNQRSMVHVDDVVQAALLAAENPKAAKQVYIVTDGTPYSTRQLYEWINQALGKKPWAINIPLLLLKTMATLGDKIGQLRGRRFMFDSDALTKLLGSAHYFSKKIEGELDFHAQHHLQQSLPEIVTYLRRSGGL